MLIAMSTEKSYLDKFDGLNSLYPLIIVIISFLYVYFSLLLVLPFVNLCIFLESVLENVEYLGWCVL